MIWSSLYTHWFILPQSSYITSAPSSQYCGNARSSLTMWCVGDPIYTVPLYRNTLYVHSSYCEYAPMLLLYNRVQDDAPSLLYNNTSGYWSHIKSSYTTPYPSDIISFEANVDIGVRLCYADPQMGTQLTSILEFHTTSYSPRISATSQYCDVLYSTDSRYAFLYITPEVSSQPTSMVIFYPSGNPWRYIADWGCEARLTDYGTSLLDGYAFSGRLSLQYIESGVFYQCQFQPLTIQDSSSWQNDVRFNYHDSNISDTSLQSLKIYTSQGLYDNVSYTGINDFHWSVLYS